MRLTDACYHAKFEFPWSSPLPATFKPDSVVPMVLVIMRIRQDQPPNIRFREDAMVMVPLLIKRELNRKA